MKSILTNPLTPGMPVVMRNVPLDFHLLISMLNGFCMTIHFFLLVCLPLALSLKDDHIRHGTGSAYALFQKWFNTVIFILGLASFIAFVQVIQLIQEKPQFNWVLHIFMFYIDVCTIYLVIPAQKEPVVDEEEGLTEKVEYCYFDAVDGEKRNL
ncbi:hypothetical protein FSARC_4535 [Fusarium sarcochroum]|uniref:Uncharacterized protein n=1 Tax=Fusarium sarcochroum TaxID=1208366 RepID=A0A8H4U1H7_9HYPO|nr:hypothetical protein FSARC_4535 [Fusarium sarcochroum]